MCIRCACITCPHVPQVFASGMRAPHTSRGCIFTASQTLCLYFLGGQNTHTSITSALLLYPTSPGDTTQRCHTTAVASVSMVTCVATFSRARRPVSLSVNDMIEWSSWILQHSHKFYSPFHSVLRGVCVCVCVCVCVRVCVAAA